MTAGSAERSTRFRSWALEDGQETAEWASEYREWQAIWDAFRRFVDLKAPASWDAEEWRDVLFAIARDFEDGVLVDDLVERRPDVLIEIAVRALKDGEIDARLQLAEGLGRVDVDHDACEALLLAYRDDDEEVVRRYALNALGSMCSRQTERIALEEWAVCTTIKQPRHGAFGPVASPRCSMRSTVSKHGRLNVC